MNDESNDTKESKALTRKEAIATLWRRGQIWYKLNSSQKDLANLLNESAILAARHNRKTVTQNDLYNSIEKVLLGPERRGRIISTKEKDPAIS